MDISSYIGRYQVAFQSIYRSVSNMIKEHVHSDITTEQFAILQIIQQDDGATSTKIAQTIGVGKSAITALVQRLVEGDFITRERNEKDRRQIYLRLTNKGACAVNQTEKAIHQYLEEKLALFDMQDTEKFLRSIEKLAKLMESDGSDRT